MKYARLENDIVVEVSNTLHQTNNDPQFIWMEAPDNVEQGWILDGGTLRERTTEDDYPTIQEYIDKKKGDILSKYKQTILSKWPVEDILFASIDGTTPAEKTEIKDDIVAVRAVAIQGYSDMNGASTYSEADTIFHAIAWPVI